VPSEEAKMTSRSWLVMPPVRGALTAIVVMGDLPQVLLSPGCSFA
jgi:hypothetical protein